MKTEKQLSKIERFMFGFYSWFLVCAGFCVAFFFRCLSTTNDTKTRVYVHRDSTVDRTTHYLGKHTIVALNQCPFSDLHFFAHVLRAGIETGRDFYILAEGSNPSNSDQLGAAMSGFYDLHIPWEVIVLDTPKVLVESVTNRVFRILSTEKPTAILVHRAFARRLLGYTLATIRREEAGIETTTARSMWYVLPTKGDWYGFYNIGHGASSVSFPRYRPHLTLLPDSQHRRKTKRNEVLLFFDIDKHLGSDFVFYPKKRLVVAQTFAFLDRFLRAFGSFQRTEIVEPRFCV